MATNDHEIMDWRVYADATCAGLSALIPIPFVDMVFEAFFRSRMAPAISRARRVDLDPLARKRLGRSNRDWLSVEGCLVLPIMVIKVILKRIWRKIIYVFAVADAASQLSDYWHRAFLLDHLIRARHVVPGVDVRRAVAVFNQALDEADTSALKGLAKQLVLSAHHVPRLLRRARRGRAENETPEQERFLRAHWEVVEDSLRQVALSYNQLYAEWQNEEEQEDL
jgi:hypothetical protein